MIIIIITTYLYMYNMCSYDVVAQQHSPGAVQLLLKLFSFATLPYLLLLRMSIFFSS